MLLNGGTVGVVLGGQVGGDMKENFEAFINKYKELIGNKYKELIESNTDNTDNNTTKKQFVKKFYKNFIAKFQKKQGDSTTSETYSPFNDEFNNIIKNSDIDSDSEKSVSDLLDFNFEDDKEEDELSSEENEMFNVIFPNIIPIISGENNIKMTTNNKEEIIRDNSIAEEDHSNMTQKSSVIIKDVSNQQTQEPEQTETKSKETKTVETKSETKEINSNDMLKVALASNYFTQYGILSGMLKMNQEKDNNKFDVMNFVQDPKLYAEFCNKMGFQFAEMKEENDVEDTVVENKDDNAELQDNNE